MKKTEIGLATVAFLGVLFKIMHYPGASSLLIISFSGLSFIYAARGMKIFNDNNPQTPISAKDKVISIVTGLALAIVLMGVLYRIMLWPGDKAILIFGLPFLAIALAAVSFFYSQDKSRIWKRAFVIGIAGFGLFAISDDTLIDFRYKNHPDLAKAFKAYRKDRSNEELKRKLEAEQDSMMIKHRMKEFQHEQR